MKKRVTQERRRRAHSKPIATTIHHNGELVGISIQLSRSEAKDYYDSVVGVYGIQRVEQLRDELDAIIRRERGL
jgi:hypothetical protein